MKGKNLMSRLVIIHEYIDRYIDCTYSTCIHHIIDFRGLRFERLQPREAVG